MAAAIWLVFSACDRPEPAPPRDSAVSVTIGSTTSARVASGSWPAELGTSLVVPGETENTAVVIYPDAPPADHFAGLSLTLLSTTGDTVAARATTRSTDSLLCGDAPVLDFSSPVAAGWSLGLSVGSTPPLRLDSIEALPSADSAQLVSDLARLASGLAIAPESRFSGLPFAVLTARRFTIGGKTFVAAHLIRRLPQEASPLEERTLLIAERGAGKDSVFRVGFSQRSEGSEETAEHFDLLSVIRLPTSTLMLLARDQLSRTDYQLMERRSAGGWRVRWSRPLTC